MNRVAAVFGLLVAVLGPAAAQSTRGDQLVMFEEKGCSFCVVWDRQVGTIYAKTDEAQTLPLRRVELNVPRPLDLRSLKRVTVAPTFVIMHCGKEFRRITGYIGEDQFWGLLDAALRDLPAPTAGTAGTSSAETSSTCKA
jgi:thioredoxin-related protein